MKKWNERFSTGREDVIYPDCPRCVHYDRIRANCPAYPKGVPWAIRTGDETHRTVRPDQVGTDVFTPLAGLDDKTVYHAQ